MKQYGSSDVRRKNGSLRILRVLVGTGSALLLLLVTSEGAHAQEAPTEQDHQLRVRLRVRILEWQLNDELDTGFTFRYLRAVDHSGNSVAAADATFPNSSRGDGLTAFFDRIKLGPGETELAIQALEQTHRLRVLSEPVLTVNAKSSKNDKPIPAKFTSGRDIPYETLRPANGVLMSVTEFRTTGITLTVDEAEVFEFKGDPTQRFVRMKFHVNVSRPGQEVPINVTAQREVVTQFQVLSRDLNTSLFIPEHSPFIAGIIKSRIETENTSGIPILSEIPIVGALFRSNNKKTMNTELVFLVTADVLWPDNPPMESAYKPEPKPELPPPLIPGEDEGQAS